MSDGPRLPPYRDPLSIPRDQRIGLIIDAPGQPFAHFCAVCGEDAGFGFGAEHLKGIHGRWYCREHRDVGERWFTTGA